MKKASKETFFGTKKKRTKSNNSYRSSHKDDYQQDQPPPMKTVADELYKEEDVLPKYSTAMDKEADSPYMDEEPSIGRK